MRENSFWGILSREARTGLRHADGAAATQAGEGEGRGLPNEDGLPSIVPLEERERAGALSTKPFVWHPLNPQAARISFPQNPAMPTLRRIL